ncbi:WXG100 family type VII secretion target [Nocardia puris]|uniref:WXG100 family type VII secretion target n=1 Tax=Nocardia puris TaxID=208602 RepID=A0A366DWQ3_9NOCA|nr:WXG100 family type VII secretion target [Nocardia puris]RBO94335.1 WXG100 family type VII secretion target [Nocardia puris]
MSQSWDGQFDVVPAEVSDAGRFVQLTAQELVNGLRAIDADVDRLLRNWTGSSAAAYRAGWDETRKGAETVLESLATLAELLGVVADTHVEVDTQRASNTSSLDLP